MLSGTLDEPVVKTEMWGGEMVDVIDMAVVQRVQIAAMQLLRGIDRALWAGIRHYSKDGRPLKTPYEVLRALQEDGEISLGGGPGAILRVDDEDQYDEYGYMPTF